MSLLHYEIYCSTEAKFVDWYLQNTSPVPTKCPNSDAHTIDPTKTAVTDPPPQSVALSGVQLDSDTAQISRIKAAPTGYTFQLHCFEVTTGSGTVVNKDYLNADLGEITAKFYDASNVLISDPANYASQAVKSQFDFEPTYDYYVIGGEMRVLTAPSTDVRLAVVAVPDVPYNSGGSRPMIQCLNLRYLSANEKVQVDGRAAKQLSYNATYHSNKLRFMIYHDVGVSVSMSVFMEFYKA